MAVAFNGERFCDAHRRGEYKRQDARRGSAHSRGYGARWRRLREQVLNREPLCRSCLLEGRVTSAAEVDHIRPKALGGGDELENLQPLCKHCHSAKTVLESVRVIRS